MWVQSPSPAPADLVCAEDYLHSHIANRADTEKKVQRLVSACWVYQYILTWTHRRRAKVLPETEGVHRDENGDCFRDHDIVWSADSLCSRVRKEIARLLIRQRSEQHDQMLDIEYEFAFFSLSSSNRDKQFVPSWGNPCRTISLIAGRLIS